MFNPDGCFCCTSPTGMCDGTGCAYSSELSDSDVTVEVFYLNSEGTSPSGSYTILSTEDSVLGDPEPCRRIRISTDSAPAIGELIYVVHWFNGLAHSTVGPYCYDQRYCASVKKASGSDSSLSDHAFVAIRQAGRSAIVPSSSTPVSFNWSAIRNRGSYMNPVMIDGQGDPATMICNSKYLRLDIGIAVKVDIPAGAVLNFDILVDSFCFGITGEYYQVIQHPFNDVCSDNLSLTFNEPVWGNYPEAMCTSGQLAVIDELNSKFTGAIVLNRSGSNRNVYSANIELDLSSDILIQFIFGLPFLEVWIGDIVFRSYNKLVNCFYNSTLVCVSGARQGSGCKTINPNVGFYLEAL